MILSCRISLLNCFFLRDRGSELQRDKGFFLNSANFEILKLAKNFILSLCIFASIIKPLYLCNSEPMDLPLKDFSTDSHFYFG